MLVVKKTVWLVEVTSIKSSFNFIKAEIKLFKICSKVWSDLGTRCNKEFS